MKFSSPVAKWMNTFNKPSVHKDKKEIEQARLDKEERECKNYDILDNDDWREDK
jgi:hypothetical protein